MENEHGHLNLCITHQKFAEVVERKITESESHRFESLLHNLLSYFIFDV